MAGDEQQQTHDYFFHSIASLDGWSALSSSLATLLEADDMKRLRLCINIDHIATLRQARREGYPDPVAAVAICEAAGADGITAHLREDRRHIQDDDVTRLARTVTTGFNLEMACTEEMLVIAERVRPHQVMFVPERRQEITTEGGLDVSRDRERLRDGIARMEAAGIPTSLFIDARRDAVDHSRELGTTSIEFHTGPYVHAAGDPRVIEGIRECARHGASLGLEIHAGHGLRTDNVGPVAAIPEIEELHIGHSVVSRAVFVGIAEAVRELRAAMDAARGPS
jgi:pyridoxine 5-phosphate synthase